MSNLEEILTDQIEAERRERIAEGEAQKAATPEPRSGGVTFTHNGELKTVYPGDPLYSTALMLSAMQENADDEQKGPDEEEQARAFDERSRSIRDALASVQEQNAAAARNHAESKCTQILESIRVALEENEDPDEALEIVKEALGL